MTHTKPPLKVFALVDCDSFYASCEGNSLFRPDLVGRSIIVASNNDSTIIARNRQAKALGIKMGEPLFKIQDIVRQNGVVVFSSNYANYANMSARVMRILGRFTPDMEVYSIDEAFLDLTGQQTNLLELGRTIKATVRSHTGLSVGVGVSTSKTLAKLASYAAKKYPATGGVVDLTCKIRQARLMEITPVEEVWGVGRRIAAKLKAMGIETAASLAEAEPRYIRDQFSVVLERTVRELRGESVLSLEMVRAQQKQIVHSRSFGQAITDFNPMREAVHCYAVKAMEKMRKQELKVKSLSVFIHTNPFSDSNYYFNSGAGQFAVPTCDTTDVLKMATGILRSIWRDGKKFVKAGVMLIELVPETEEQMQLIDAANPRSEKLMKVMDEINLRGKSKIFFASQGIGKRDWEMKRQFLSPHYLTRWSDIPEVR